jgi:hypothetical protein
MSTDRGNSFYVILETLREDNLEIEMGINSEDVFVFVNWIESTE